jgi:hypothetical protein
VWEPSGPNTEILFAGYETLKELTRQARTLLIDYYSTCETIYQEGVKSWIDSQPGPGGSNNPGERVLLRNPNGQVSAPPPSAPPAAPSGPPPGPPPVAPPGAPKG